MVSVLCSPTELLLSPPALVVFRCPVAEVDWASPRRWAGHDVSGCTAPKRNCYFAEGTTRDNAQDGVFEEYICIQNPGAEEVTVTVDYLYGNTGMGMEELKIAPGARSAINVVNRIGINKDIAGIMVASDGNIVCERAMYFEVANLRLGRGLSHSSRDKPRHTDPGKDATRSSDFSQDRLFISSLWFILVMRN